MNPKKIITLFTFLALILTSCANKHPPPVEVPRSEQGPASDQLITSSGTFILTSSAVSEGGALPKEFTCDGNSATLSLSWSGAPEDTKSFAVVMHHVPGPGDIHWYWVLYNIPASITSLEKNITGVGILGNNSVNYQTVYAPPCSKGPGEKLYTYTVYALSEEPQLTVPTSDVSRDVLLDAIKYITLASASLNVMYTR